MRLRLKYVGGIVPHFEINILTASQHNSNRVPTLKFYDGSNEPNTLSIKGKRTQEFSLEDPDDTGPFWRLVQEV